MYATMVIYTYIKITNPNGSAHKTETHFIKGYTCFAKVDRNRMCLDLPIYLYIQNIFANIRVINYNYGLVLSGFMVLTDLMSSTDSL